MIFRKKRSLAGLVGLLALGIVALDANPSRASTSPSAAEPANLPHKLFGAALPLRPDDPFGKDIKSFVASAREAEKLTNPLKRCLAYPDPPGSHWTREAVVAYCHYRFRPTISFAEVRDLIQHDKAAELDRRLADALQAQLTQPDARGELDSIFVRDFEDGSLATRSLLDAWKRQSPDSAYAYAASGYAYVIMAHDQRGGAFAKYTPQEKMDAMNRLLDRADLDLQHAMKLNPRIIPIYRAMIHAAGLGFGEDYAVQAMDRALHVDPSDWTIYREMMWLEEPQWFGSPEAMQNVADSAMKHVKQNPLLWMEKMAVAQYEANVYGCDCAPPPEAPRFPAAFDELASAEFLSGAGSAAAKQGFPAIAVVYLSEAIRFDSATDSFRQQRAPQLALVGEPEMALDEANKLIKAAPHVPANYIARGKVYESVGGDVGRVERDFETALDMDPDNYDALVDAGNLYVNTTEEWDKAWNVTDRLISKYPDNRGAWVWRAMIQEVQPRPGLQDTYQYFLAHFSDDPSMKWQIDHMREVLASTSQAPIASPPATH
jgi:tetratricopeptide (TPR) repeat protein